MELPDYPTTFRTLFPLIFGVAYRRLRHREQAEDVAQEVFTVGYRKYQQFQDQTLDDYRNYLWTVCKNRCSKILARGGRRPTETGPDSGSAPDAALSFSVRQICHSALEEEEYLIVVLYYVEGHTYEEIGGILGRSTTWVFTRVRAIKTKLREALQGHDLQQAWPPAAPSANEPSGEAR